MRPVSPQLLNLSIGDPQGFGVERGERERMERERERMEQERVEQERVEQEFLFRRLKPVEAGYHLRLHCMEDT